MLAASSAMGPADSLAWDWPWIQKLFKEPGTWPANLAGHPEILLFDADSGEKFIDALERDFSGGLRRHHSLDDAKANRLGWIAACGDIGLETRAETPTTNPMDEWSQRVMKNMNRMAVDEDYRKSIAKNLS